MALSYCWGDLGETRRINMTHVTKDTIAENQRLLERQTFNCTANLEMPLRGLRREGQDSWLWVDALCI
jgi:Heterokaryon incompatibility protein (HET)